MLSTLKSSKKFYFSRCYSNKILFPIGNLQFKLKSGLFQLNKRNFSSEVSWNIPKFEENPNKFNQKLGYGLTITILSFFGFSIYNDVWKSKNNEATLFENQPEKRLKLTYAYLLSSLSLTSISLLFLTKTNLLAINRKIPLIYLFISLSLMIITLVRTLQLDYKTQAIKKHGYWLMFNITVAANLISIGKYVGSPLIAQAFLVTGCLVGGLSIVGMKITDENARYLRAFLGIGIGIITGATLGYLFFPIPWFYSIFLYGGLITFNSSTIIHTDLLIKNAKNKKEFDPLLESLGLYLDFIQIFARIFELLIGENEKIFF